MPIIKSTESAKSKDKPYKLIDHGSLYLYITSNNARSWRFDYQFNGKRKTLTISKYPYLVYQEIKRGKRTIKKLLAHGRDPSFERKKSAMLANFE